MNSKTKVVNLHKQDYDVYIGRGYNGEHIINTDPFERGWLGNPFELSDYDRKESIKKFKKVFYDKLKNDKEFKNAIKKVKGKTLGCFCKPKSCHGDIIKEYLDGVE